MLKEEYYKNPKRCKKCNSYMKFEQRRNTFCSSSCSASYNNIGMNRKWQTQRHEYDKNKKKCLECNEYLSFEKRGQSFCSKSCNGKHQKNLGILLMSLSGHCCKNCGNKTRTYKQNFCSCKCSLEFHKKNKMVVVENKIQKGEYVCQRQIKRHILRLRPHKCEICGNTEWLGKPIGLILDHINGNSDNNHLDNLRLVCGNCDMQLPTYKGKNKGNGRYARRQRYAAGKSY